MEIFGPLFALPVILAASWFVPGLIHKFLGKSVFVRIAAALLPGVVLVALAAEIVLIARFGLVGAHDKFHPLLDRMQGYNTIFGPLALTCFAVMWMRKMPLKVMKWCAGFVCFCAFAAAIFSNLFYDSAAHYRADSEGTYRIEEK